MNDTPECLSCDMYIGWFNFNATAFSLKNPIIVLDEISSESGKDIQLGYMQMFAGAITGIRNPKAHANITITPEEAIHFLFLASLFMRKLDNSKY